MVDNLSSVIQLLCSHLKLDRDKGVCELEKLLHSHISIDRSSLENYLLQILRDSKCSWEMKHGAICGTKALISNMKNEVCTSSIDPEFLNEIERLSVQLISDPESRVRIEAGQLLGILCQLRGGDVYINCKNEMFALIGDDDQNDENKDKDKIIETTVKTLKQMVEGCGNSFGPYIDDNLAKLLLRCMTHQNRYVREGAFYLCAAIIDINSDELTPIFNAAPTLVDLIANGLSDSWSEVRLAACSTARAFLLAYPEESRRTFYPKLLPRLCFNRYYAAEGVRTYSQETWRQIAGHNGKELVQQYLEPTINYYEEASYSENFEEKETACNCFSEVVSKLSSEVVRPYVKKLLMIILRCCEDNYWTVRDAACLACGTFISSYPDELAAHSDKMLTVLLKNLGDPISTLRQSSASTTAQAVRMYGDSVLKIVMDFIQKALQDVEKSGLKEHVDELNKGPTNRPPIRRHSVSKLTQLDSSEDFGNIAYSPIKCSEAWEVADGCIYLVGELSAIPDISNSIVYLTDAIKYAAEIKTYPQHVILLENICKQLPVISKNLGKRTFKAIVESFFDAIFYSLECENSMTSSAASQCLNQLTTMLGPGIMRGKIKNFNPKYLEKFESVLHVAAF